MVADGDWLVDKQRRCRECRANLILGKNWTPVQQKARNYICRQCVAAYNKSYRAGHRQELTVRMRHWREAHKEHLSAYRKHRRKVNRTRQTATRRRWADANRDKTKLYYRRWYETDPDRAKAVSRRAEAKRRARLAGALIGIVDREAIFKSDSYRCVYCGAKSNLVLDHIVPLAKGGAHIEENLVTACRYCNASKGAKILVVWMLQRRL